jgi:predicted RND superfamily exporter protein
MWGVSGALKSNSNDPRQWLPKGFEETKKYDWLQKHFGNDEMTVVSWPGCTLADMRTEQLAATLLSNPESSFFQRAVSGRQTLRTLVRKPLKVPLAEGIERLKGVLVGPDGRTTCVVLTISERGAADRAGAIAQIRQVAEEVCGIDPSELRFGGPTVDAATIDIESQRLLLELAGLSGAVALLLMWVRLRSVRLAVIVLFIAVYSTGLALSILYYTGGNMNLVMTMLPPLVFVLSISAAVHLVNYYRDAMEDGPPDEAPVQALLHGWRPCTLASGTTAMGLLSLGVSEIVPVKMFGIYSSAGMLASLATVLVVLPVALTVWPGRAAGPSHPSGNKNTRVDDVVDRICRHHTGILAVAFVLMVLTGVGLFSLRSTVKLQYRFGAKSRILQDYRWLEEHLGPLVPMELVLHFAADSPLDFMEQVQRVGELQQRLRQLPDVGAALSGADFTPAIPEGGSARAVIERVYWRRNSAAIEEKLTQSGLCARGDYDQRLWRISVRASALSDVDYGRFVDTLRETTEPYISKLAGARATYTGVIPLIYKAQRELLNDLVESFLLAFAVIAIVMVLVLRSLRAGLLAMIPNVFPAVVIFGLMGWCRIWIEIGSIMTASAAMGIAVDDTFHLLAWHRRGVRLGLTRHDAMRFSVHRCAGAMIHTTLICSFALLVFSLSSFMPIRRFSWLMASLLLAAVVGDLVLLPAMLAGPLGRFFSPTKDPQTPDQPGTPLSSSLGEMESAQGR